MNQMNNEELLEKTLIVQADPPLETEDDVALLILVLESKKNGGGDTLKTELSDNKKVLTVVFEETEVKNRFLQMKTMKLPQAFKNFTLTFRAPFSKSSCEKDDKVLIIRNFADTFQDNGVELYVDYIVRDSELKKVEKSRIFKDTYVAEFESAFDFEKVQKRLQKKPNVFGRDVELLEAYKTATIVGRNEDKTDLENDYLEMHFSNEKRSGTSDYLSYRDVNKHFIIHLPNDDVVRKVLEKSHSVNSKKLIVEKLYNFDMENFLNA